ncbi:MAG: rod shape-determining protein MreC [Solirubrobacteraceae bacterium]
MHDKQVRRRRAVLALLVGVSLILLTAYFGESPSSPLHNVQRGIVEVISPIQQGASTVLSPVKDVAGWFSDTLHAKSESDQLRKQVNTLTKQLDYYQQKATLANQLAAQVRLDNTNSISSYRPVTAGVISRDPTLWYQTITVDKGSDDGVGMNDPVTGDGALVGKVTTLDPAVSVVTLITDHSFAVTAQVFDPPGSDTGVLVPAVGNPNQLLLQQLPSNAPIQAGQRVVTAGFEDPADPALDSLYPPGIPIGQVSNNVNQNELVNSQQVPVVPAADLRHLSVVQILIHPHAGAARAQVP